MRGSGFSMRRVWSLLVAVGVVFAIWPDADVEAHQPHDDIVLVAYSPTFAEDQTVFVSTGYLAVTFGVQVLLRSTDGGLTWLVAPNYPNYQINGLAISPAFNLDGTLFASTATGGLYRSVDGGDSWTNLTAEGLGTATVGVAVSPAFAADGTVVAAGIDGLVYKSTDRGDTWAAQPITGGFPDELPDPLSKTVIAFSPSYAVDETIFVALDGVGLFRTVDGGATWSAIGDELTGIEVASLALAPAFAWTQLMYAGTYSGAFISLDGGDSWSPINGGLESQTVTSIALSPVFLSDRTAYLATAEGDAYRSVNWGVTWVRLPSTGRKLSGQSAVHYRRLGISPSFGSDQMLFLSTFEGLWKSDDRGDSWRYVDVVPTYLVRSMSVSPDYQADGTVFASTYGGGLLRTVDGGASWVPLTNGIINAYPDATAISDSYPELPVVFAGTGFGPQRSTDGGDSWTFQPVLGTPMYARGMAMSPDFANDLTVVLAVDNLGTGFPRYAYWNDRWVSTEGIFISRSGGASWVPTQVNGIGVESVAISPSFTQDGTIYAASLFDGLFHSGDGGYTWSAFPAVPADCCLSRVALSPNLAADQTLFIGRVWGLAPDRGLYRSADGGQTWARTPGSEAITPLDFVLSPAFAEDGTIFVATLERGVLKSVDGGQTLTPTGLEIAYVTALAISPTFEMDQTLFAGTYDGTYKSDDAGNTWVQTTLHTRVEEVHPALSRVGNWQWVALSQASAGHAFFSNVPGESVTMNYVGRDVSLVGATGPNLGILDIFLDGELVANVDMYTPDVHYQVTLWETEVLAFGEHTLTVVISNENNPASSGYRALVDAYEVWR